MIKIEKTIPKEPRRDYVKRTARKLLLSSGASSLPIDVDRIFTMNGILMYSADEAVSAANMPLPNGFVTNSSISAITQFLIINDKKFYVTIYKTHDRNIGNIRFSKAHELGHIHLKHFENYSVPSSYDIQENHALWVLEREAEMFAAELLAPTAILRACQCVDKNSIQSLCNISAEASEYAVSDIKKDYHLKESDKASLEQQFYSYIKNKEYLSQVSYSSCGVCGNAIITDNQYCNICGDNFKKAGMAKETVFYKSSIETKPTGRVYYCQKCGNFNIPAGSLECNICKAPLYNICRRCKTKASSDSRFCPNCGTRTPFFDAGLLFDWKVSPIRSRLPSNVEGFRKLNSWEFIVNKFLLQEKFEIHHFLRESVAFENSGIISIYIANTATPGPAEPINLLQVINDISLSYFDITYDEINIVVI